MTVTIVGEERIYNMQVVASKQKGSTIHVMVTSINYLRYNPSRLNPTCPCPCKNTEASNCLVDSQHPTIKQWLFTIIKKRKKIYFVYLKYHKGIYALLKCTS